MRVKTLLLCIALMLTLAASTAAQDKKKSKDDYTKHPGYIDFDPADIFGDAEAKVEVNLKQPMLNLVSKFAKEEDPELVELLGKLALVRVQVYEADAELIKKFETESSKAVKELDNKGWERIVKVRDGYERVIVYLKPSSDYEYIQGIVVIAVEFDEAVFVNIVGDIHPEDIDDLGEYLGIEELDSIRYETKKGK